MTGENEGGQQGLQVKRVQSAYGQVAEQLKEQIVSGALEAGTKLPSEAELAKLFGVSRSTVREALRLLASQQLIDTTRGVTGGSFVSAPDASSVAENLGGSLGLLVSNRNLTVANLLEARLILEPSAARVAATRADPEMLEWLRGTIEKTSELTPEHGFIVHWDFHSTLVAMTGNPLLKMMCHPINAVLRTQVHREGVAQEVWDEVDQDHARIFEAVAARDPEAAEHLTRQHLNNLRPLYKQLVEQGEAAVTG